MTDGVGSFGLDRPLGFTEALCARWYEAIPQGLQLVCAALSTRPLEAAELIDAVDRVFERHPATASRIVTGDDGRLRYAPAERDEIVVSVAPPGTSWRERFAIQLADPLDLGLALWRVELVPHPVDAEAPAAVLVTGCHAIFDGMSAATVARELLASADEPTDDAIGGVRLPAMEDRMPPTGPRPAPGVSPERERWVVARSAPANERDFGFLDRTVDATTLTALHDRAHSAGTTIGALLAVACTRARHVVPGSQDRAGFNVPFDGRLRVVPPLPASSIGAYFGRAHVFASGTQCDTEPEAAARALSDQLHGDLAAFARPEWTDESLAALLAELCRDDRTSFDLAFIVTDLGRRDLGPSIAEFFFTAVQTTGLEALIVSAASHAEKLFLGVGWPRPLVDDAVAARFTDELVAQITTLASAPHPR